MEQAQEARAGYERELAQRGAEIDRVNAAALEMASGLQAERAALQQQLGHLEGLYSALVTQSQVDKDIFDRRLQDKAAEIERLLRAVEDKSRATEEEVRRLADESLKEIESQKNKRINARNETIEMAQALDRARVEASDIATLIKYNLVPLVYEQIYAVESLLMGLDIVQNYILSKSSGGGAKASRGGPRRPRDRTASTAAGADGAVGALEQAHTLQSDLYRLQTGITLLNQSLTNVQETIGANDASSSCCTAPSSIFDLVAIAALQSPAKKGEYSSLNPRGADDDRVKLTLARDESG